ncbi:MAG: super-infection exclusion protein B [Anaerolineaceae bacterium]
MEILTKILGAIKLPYKVYFAMTLLCGFLIFSPGKLLQRLSLDFFVFQYKSWISILFLFSFSLSLVYAIPEIFSFIKKEVLKVLKKRYLADRLNNLSKGEKKVLFDYIDQDQRTQYFEIGDGIIRGLEAEGFLFRSSTTGTMFSWAFNIQPWVWKHIKKNYPRIFSEAEIEEFRKKNKK